MGNWAPKPMGNRRSRDFGMTFTPGGLSGIRVVGLSAGARGQRERSGCQRDGVEDGADLYGALPEEGSQAAGKAGAPQGRRAARGQMRGADPMGFPNRNLSCRGAEEGSHMSSGQSWAGLCCSLCAGPSVSF